MINTNVHPLRSATLGAVLLLILAACGGAAAPTATPGGPTTPPGQPTPAPTSAPVVTPPAGVAIDACTLLTVEEVSAAWGDTLEGAVSTSVAPYSYCAYGAGGEVDTWVLTDATAAASVFGTMKINDGEAVSGVGDEAYWSTDSFQPGLYFLKGGIGGFISGPQSGPDDAIVQLGVLMASRI